MRDPSVARRVNAGSAEPTGKRGLEEGRCIKAPWVGSAEIFRTIAPTDRTEQEGGKKRSGDFRSLEREISPKAHLAAEEIAELLLRTTQGAQSSGRAHNL